MVKPIDPNEWYWTPEKLNALVATLRVLAQRDSHGYYFGPKGLAEQIKDVNRSNFGDVGARMGNGLQILVFLKFLEPGKTGTKKPSYKRRFYPNRRSSIRWRDIEQYRTARDRKNRPWKYSGD